MQGESLGPYLIDRELGAGGMGKVYAAVADESARAVAPGVRVALKVVHPHLLETPGFFKRFLREAEIGKKVRHENVVRTLDCDSVMVDGQRHDYLAMEYVEGQTLRELLAEMEQVPEELCRHIGREVSKGLAAIHAAGVVHRDMKPENVLITSDHVVKVMDLGVARLMDEAVRLSQTGAFVGSLHYAAPEQFAGDGEGIDARADLHALGLVLYELSTGRHPFSGDSVGEIVGHVLRTVPRKVGLIHPQLSAFFEEALDCLLAKDRERRFASATDLLAALEAGEQSAWWRARSRTLQAETRRPIRRIRIPRETAVYGREEDLTKLTSLYEQAKSGDGQVVLIEGEAGIGKSRVVDELIGRLQRDGEELHFLFGSYPPGGAATAAGAFSTAFREQFGDGGSAAYLPQTPVLVPAFDALLRGETTPPGCEPLTKDSLQTCFVHATRSLAAERTTVVLIDDLHFATEEARALFTSLALAVPGHGVLLIGTTRSGIDQKWLAGLTRLPQTSQMTLQRLGPKDLAELLRDSLRSESLALSLAGQIGVKSDGNPFFVFEIMRGLREGQFLTQKDDGTWVSTRVIGEIQIPSSVLDLVNARVADLSEEERDLLDVACCWGFEFDAGLVADVVGMRRIPLYKQLAQIERRHRLLRSSGRNFVFDHHQVQEALYGSLPEVLREEYHAALAEALETRTKAAENDLQTLDGSLSVDLCEHYFKGARGERALRYLERATEHLTSGHLHAQVIALTERALAVPDLLTGVERARALLRQAAALDPLGRRARQEEAAREAERLAEEAGDEEVRSQAALALGVLFSRTSRQEEAERCHRRAQEIARAREDKSAEAGATANLGNVFLALGRLPEAREHYERSLAISREIGDRAGEVRATVNLGVAFFSLGRLPEAKEHYERGIAISREIGLRQGEASATVNLGHVLQDLGRLPEAREHYERSLAISREIGNRQDEAGAMGSLGLLLLSQGRLPEAKEHHERGLAICREIGFRQGEAGAAGNLGNVFLALGRLPEASEQLERQLAICREIGYREGEAIALVNLGPTWHALGDRARAREALEQSVALCREIGARYAEGYGLLDLGRLADEEGEAAEALRLTEESLALRRAIEHGDGVADALLALGNLRARSGDAEDARTALEKALSLARAQDRGAVVAQTLADLAALPGAADDASATALRALADLAEHEDTPKLRWALWRATGDRAHLAEAKRLLDEALSKVPAEHHEAMRQNRRVHREILAAWREVIGEEDGPQRAGSVTRVGSGE